jgi:hypothetical protein
MNRKEAIARFVAFGRGHRRAREPEIDDADPRLLEQFTERVMSNPDEYLSRLVDSVEARRRGLSPDAQTQIAALEDALDLFGPLAFERKETAYSRVLAWALSPSSNGQLGEAPLAALLGAVERKQGAAHPADRIDADWAHHFEDGDAVAEHCIPGGRIDVWLSLPDACIAIETKIGHSERDNQAAEYHRYAKLVARATKHRRSYLVWLSLEEPDKVRHVHAINLTWKDLLVAWLPIATGTSSDHRYLGAYLRSIAQHLVELADDGPFSTWGPSRQEKVLSLFSERS